MSDFPILHDNGGFRIWQIKAEEVFQSFGSAGKACVLGARNDPQFPAILDKLKDINGLPTAINRFDLTPDSELTADGLKDFKRAVDKYPTLVDIFEKGGNTKLTDFFNRYLSSDIKKSLASNKAWVAACNATITDNFTKWTILVRLYSHGTAKTKNRTFREFLSLTQGDNSLPHFAEAVNNGAITMSYNFGSTIHPGFIAMDDIKLLVFLTGLNQLDCKFFLDKWYVDNPTGTSKNVDEVMDAVAVYYREHIAEASANQYAVSLVANTKVLKCNGCDVPIPYVLNERGIPHSKCQPCFRKFLSEINAKKLSGTRKVSSTAKPGPVVPKLSQADKTAARVLANVAASGGTSSSSSASVASLLTLVDSDNDSEED